MTPAAAPSFRHRFCSLGVVVASCALLMSVPHEAGALDGAADFQQSDQHARSDLGTFRTYFRRETLSARQAVPFSPLLSLEVRARTVRETTGGDATGGTRKIVRTNRQPDATLTYRTRPLSVGLKMSWFEQDVSGSSTLASESTRRQQSAWLNFKLPSKTLLSSSVTRTVAEETSFDGIPSEDRQTSGFVLAEQGLGDTWLSQYRFTGLSGDVTRLGSHREQTSHSLELRGSPRFGGDRLVTTFRARSQLFDQRVRADTGEEVVRLEMPLAAGFTLDDTPLERDPLEGSVTPVPALVDGNRTEPTVINIGDSAPAVREFGGDYRNIEFDFGDTVLPASGTLFVSEPVVQPQLFQWRVFVSEEPEGRIWEEVGTDRFSARYREFGTILQGWEFSFTDVAGRYLKFVDVKLGVTNPDLYVTEAEFSTRTLVGRSSSDDRTLNHRLDASLVYAATSSLSLGYQTALRRRDRQDSDVGDLSGANHTFTSRWSEGLYAAAAQLDLQRLTSVTRRSTDVIATSLSLTRSSTGGSSTTAAWTRTDDRGAGQNRTTDTYALRALWRPAPRLQLDHRLSHGRRHDQASDTRSRSFTMSHTVRSNPWKSLMANLDRSDRWVSESAGAGFERFHDTGADVVWALASRLHVSGDLRVQGRSGDSEWSNRQSLLWTPLPGPPLETHISGSSFYDSRTRVRRWGSDVSGTWRPRRSLIVEGSVGFQRYEVEGVLNTPIDTSIRVGMSF